MCASARRARRDYVTDLVRRDLAPDPAPVSLAQSVELFERRMQRVYERTTVWMRGAYACMASFNLFWTRFLYELCVYYLDYVWGFACDDHLATDADPASVTPDTAR